MVTIRLKKMTVIAGVCQVLRWSVINAFARRTRSFPWTRSHAATVVANIKQEKTEFVLVTMISLNKAVNASVRTERSFPWTRRHV